MKNNYPKPKYHWSYLRGTICWLGTSKLLAGKWTNPMILLLHLLGSWDAAAGRCQAGASGGISHWLPQGLHRGPPSSSLSMRNSDKDTFRNVLQATVTNCQLLQFHYNFGEIFSGNGTGRCSVIICWTNACGIIFSTISLFALPQKRFLFVCFLFYMFWTLVMVF